MGSHGGGTAEGQRELLAEYGISQAAQDVTAGRSQDVAVERVGPAGVANEGNRAREARADDNQLVEWG